MAAKGKNNRRDCRGSGQIRGICEKSDLFSGIKRRRKTMICPECGRELEKGIIEAKDACMKVFASFEEK